MSCRICFESGIMYKLPCACRDTLGYVHAHCFVRWMVRRYPSKSGHACEVCNTPYSRLQRAARHEYQQAVYMIMRCMHAFVAYAICLLSFCCFWALSHDMPIDDDTCNAGLSVILLLTVGTLVHMYTCVMYKVPGTEKGESETMLQHFIMSCDKVEVVEHV